MNNTSNIDKIKDYVNGVVEPKIRVGYLPPAEKRHKDGEIWKDKNGTEWVQIKNSKISKKLYDAREITKQICSSCKKDIRWSSDKNDTKMFNKTGKCYDCIIEEETKMRLDGTFEIYEKIKVIKNQKSFLLDLQQKIKESLVWLENKSNKIEYLNEDGSSECWTDRSREEFIKGANNDLQEIKKSLAICEESIITLNTQLETIKNSKK